MTQTDQIDFLIESNNGIIQTAQVLEAGISKPVFYNYVNKKELRQAAHGIYVTDDAWVDGMYLLHLRCPKAVFSHETALFFHELTDREPISYSVTVERGYNPSRLTADGIMVHTIRSELYKIGIEKMQTSFGHFVPVYDKERTVCDVLHNRKKMEIQVFQGALKHYVQDRDKNLHKLSQYAEYFRVEKILRRYLEVLL